MREYVAVIDFVAVANMDEKNYDREQWLALELKEC